MVKTRTDKSEALDDESETEVERKEYKIIGARKVFYMHGELKIYFPLKM